MSQLPDDVESTITLITREGQRLRPEGIPAALLESLKLPMNVAARDTSVAGYTVGVAHQPLVEYRRPQLGLADAIQLMLGAQSGELPRKEVGSNLDNRLRGNGRRPDRHVVDFVERHAGGIIQCGPGVSRALVAAALVDEFPEAKIAFIVGGRRAGHRFTGELARIIKRPVPYFDGLPSSDDKNRRVIVSTYVGLSKAYPEHEKRNLIVCLDQIEAIAEQAQFALAHCRDARLFAFSGVGEQWSPRERYLITSTFGFGRICVPQHGCRLRTVEVRHASHDDQRRTSESRNHQRWQAPHLTARQVIGSAYRSRRVAVIGRDAAAGKLPRFSGNGIDELGRPLRTIVVARDMRHAGQIVARMPGWPIVTAADVVARPPGDIGAVRSRLATEGSPTGCGVVTVMGLDAVNLASVDVIVWAASGNHGPHIAHHRLHQPYDDTTPLRLIDVVDTGHPPLRRQARHRAARYAEREWFRPDANPHAERVIAFVGELRRQARAT